MNRGRHFRLLNRACAVFWLAAVTLIIVTYRAHFLSRLYNNLGYILLNGEKASDSFASRRSELFFDRALTISPVQASAWRGKGIVLDAQGWDLRALKAFQQSNETPEYFTQWGHLAFKAQKYSEALTWYDRALTLQPATPITWFFLGRTYEVLLDGARALSSYETALELAKQGDDMTLDVSTVYYHQGMVNQWLIQPSDLEAAIKAYQTAICLDDFATPLEKADSYTRLAQIWQWWERDVNQQITWLEIATSTDPTYPTSHVLLGYAYYLNGSDVSVAEREIQKALVINPSYASAYWHLGEIYYREGLIERAIAMYEYALDLDPNHWMAQQRVTELRVSP